MDFLRQYLVHYYEADSAQQLTLPALIQYFEDIAILHSASCGFDLEYYDANHCAWMLLKWDVSIHCLPRFGQTVTVGTRVHAIKRFLADREFLLSSEDGTVLAEARSNWLFADTIRRRPVKVPEIQYEYFKVGLQDEASFISIDDVSPVLESGEQSVGARAEIARNAIHTVNSDIDTNRHVNNVRYIDWALDALPLDFASSHSPSSLHVQYKKELGLGCDASVFSVLEMNAITHTVAANIRAGVDTTASIVSPILSRHTIRSMAEDFCSIEIGWKSKM
jgi:medium-chain acyl-[acyl-carrier-protein] hydrolase